MDGNIYIYTVGNLNWEAGFFLHSHNSTGVLAHIHIGLLKIKPNISVVSVSFQSQRLPGQPQLLLCVVLHHWAGKSPVLCLGFYHI